MLEIYGYFMPLGESDSIGYLDFVPMSNHISFDLSNDLEKRIGG